MRDSEAKRESRQAAPVIHRLWMAVFPCGQSLESIAGGF
jgi:hypothetical protein